MLPRGDRGRRGEAVVSSDAGASIAPVGPDLLRRAVASHIQHIAAGADRTIADNRQLHRCPLRYNWNALAGRHRSRHDRSRWVLTTARIWTRGPGGAQDVDIDHEEARGKV